MINAVDLYSSIENDLHLHAWQDEDPLSFHARLIYSALADWVLSLSTDRDAEQEDETSDCVLKVHVTNVARDTLLSFLHIDPSLSSYFPNDKILDFVKTLEDYYVSLGYFDSDEYEFVRAKYKALIRMDETSLMLHIDYPCRFHGMTGIGLYRLAQQNDPANISPDDYLCSPKTAVEVFQALARTLKYEPLLADSLKGRIDYYDFVNRRWDLFSESDTHRFGFLVLRFDKMSYSLVKTLGGKAFIAPLPAIYNPIVKDPYHQKEIWRIIMGCSANQDRPFEAAFLTDEKRGFSEISFSGFLLPDKENAFLHCLCWPKQNCLDPFHYSTRSVFIPTIKYVLSLFNVQIIEVKL